MSKLRGAIIGAGLIARSTHVPAFLRHRNKVDLVAVCDLNQQAAHSLASANGIANSYGSLSEMLDKQRLDFVAVCTPPQTHASVAIAAMARGCHVLCEKPLAATVADCDAIVEASRAYGVKVCVAHSDLFYWPVMRAREIVARGEIGEFRGMQICLSTATDYMTSHENHWAHKLPGGVLGETGPHVAYMSLAFINPIRRVTVDAIKLLEYPWSPFEDFRINLIGDKAISSATLTYATKQWQARVELFGAEGTLTLDLEGQYLVKRRRDNLRPLTIGKSVLSEARQILVSLFSNTARYVSGGFATSHDILLRKFVDSLLDGEPPPVSAEEGRETVRVTKMIAECLQAQHAPGVQS
jgi:predicted dehydrogenase